VVNGQQPAPRSSENVIEQVKLWGGMKTTKHQSILIAEPNVQFREELYNFLLADGYEYVTTTDSLATVPEYMRHAAYDVILADAGAPLDSGLQIAKNLVTLRPTMKIILMIKAEDQQAWNELAIHAVGVHFLIKAAFARDLLYLLANRT
jgi:DNA-binding NarL/FixJ family response regulator